MARNGQLEAVFHSGDKDFIEGLGHSVEYLASVIEKALFADGWLKTGTWVEVTSPLNLLFTRGRIPQGRILDIGAGNGMMTHILADANPRSIFYGCDINVISKTIEAKLVDDPQYLSGLMSAVRHRLDIHQLNVPVKGISGRTAPPKPYQISSRPLGGWIDAHSPNIPCEDGFFRAVTSFQAFHDMVEPDGFFSEAARLTVRNGELFMSIMNPYAVEMLDSLSYLFGHNFKADDPFVSTLRSHRCEEDVLAQYLQRILVLAAGNGFEVSRIGRFPFGNPILPYTREEKEQARDRFNSRFADRLGEDGYVHPKIEKCPLICLLEFKKKDPSKIFVPEIDTWVGYMDASVPERPLEKDQSNMRIEMLPQPSRSAGRSR